MKIKNKTKGFSLIEMLLVLSISIAISTLKYLEIKNDHEIFVSHLISDQLKEVGAAANVFISKRAHELFLKNGDNYIYDATCKDNNVCEIKISTLKSEGLINYDKNFDFLHKYNYKIFINKNDYGPHSSVKGIILLNKPIKEYSGTSKMNGHILKNVGIDSGVLKNDKINGYKGIWKTKLIPYISDYDKSSELIILNVGYNSEQYSIFLLKDGTLPMLGNFNFDKNNLNNISTLNSENLYSDSDTTIKSAKTKEMLTSKNKTHLSGVNILSGKTNISGDYFTITTDNSFFDNQVSLKKNLNISENILFEKNLMISGNLNTEHIKKYWKYLF